MLASQILLGIWCSVLCTIRILYHCRHIFWKSYLQGCMLRPLLLLYNCCNDWHDLIVFYCNVLILITGFQTFVLCPYVKELETFHNIRGGNPFFFLEGEWYCCRLSLATSQVVAGEMGKRLSVQKGHKWIIHGWNGMYILLEEGQGDRQRAFLVIAMKIQGPSEISLCFPSVMYVWLRSTALDKGMITNIQWQLLWKTEYIFIVWC